MQGQWIAQIFRDLKMLEYIGRNGIIVDIYRDNQGALALVKNPHLYKRSKYIDIYYHYIRDLAEKGKLEIIYIPITNMPIDRMTKPFARVAFERFKKLLGIEIEL